MTKYTVTDINALEAAFPQAVETVKKPNRRIITKLLDCGFVVPGVAIEPPTVVEPQRTLAQVIGKGDAA